MNPPEVGSNDVAAALHLLGESLEAEVNRINDEGSQAMKQGDYDTAQAVIDFARRLQAFRGKVADLGSEWDVLEEMRDKATVEVQRIVSNTSLAGKGAARSRRTWRTVGDPESTCGDGWRRPQRQSPGSRGRDDEGHPETQGLRTPREQPPADSLAQPCRLGSQPDGQWRPRRPHEEEFSPWHLGDLTEGPRLAHGPECQ